MLRSSKSAKVPLLVPLHGALDRKPRSIDRNVVTMGRAHGCDIHLEADDISALHCLIYRAGDGLHLRDCDSRAGTRLNGEPVTNHVLLDGDVILLGPFSFVLQIPEAELDVGQGTDLSKANRHGRSRRNLAGLALKLRKRLRETLANPDASIHKLDHKAAELRMKIHEYDQRATQLEQAEREQERDRATLDRDIEKHNAHVQQVENDLARRLSEADEEVHAKWLAFQERCRREDIRRECAKPVHLTVEQESVHAESEELFEKRMATLAQAESSLHEQRAEVSRMIGDLRALQESIRSHQSADVASLVRENEELRAQLADVETRLATTTPTAGPGAKSPNGNSLETENEILKRLLTEKDEIIEEARRRQALAPPLTQDLEKYEVELHQYRQQLESDRATLNAEIDHLRIRNQEMDKSLRDMEMEMSRERADLARERTRLDRLRDDVRAELERTQRDASMRETFGSVKKLREEIVTGRK